MGDPKQMLRAINPKEASLFDAALGVHIRYRLGGYQFPPNIYYKIFTHKPVCDVGAFAPRNYTIGRSNPIHTADIHNKVATADASSKYLGSSSSVRVGTSVFHAVSNLRGQDEQKYGWYERYENNGWRAITIQVLELLDEDPVTKYTRSIPVRFHYSKLQRKEEVERKRKERNREWLRKLYTAG